MKFPSTVIHSGILIGLLRRVYAQVHKRTGSFGHVNGTELFNGSDVILDTLGAIGEAAVALSLGAPVKLEPPAPTVWNAFTPGKELPDVDIVNTSLAGIPCHIDVFTTTKKRARKPKLILQSDDETPDVFHVLVSYGRDGIVDVVGAIEAQEALALKNADDKRFYRWTSKGLNKPRAVPLSELVPIPVDNTRLFQRAMRLDRDVKSVVIEHLRPLRVNTQAFFEAVRHGICCMKREDPNFDLSMYHPNHALRGHPLAKFYHGFYTRTEHIQFLMEKKAQ